MSDKTASESQVPSSNPKSVVQRVRIYYWPARDVVGDPGERSIVVDEDVAAELSVTLENMGYEVIIEDL